MASISIILTGLQILMAAAFLLTGLALPIKFMDSKPIGSHVVCMILCAILIIAISPIRTSMQNEYDNTVAAAKETQDMHIKQAVTENWEVYIDGVLTEQKLDTIELSKYDVNFAENDKVVSLSKKVPQSNSDTGSFFWMLMYLFK